MADHVQRLAITATTLISEGATDFERLHILLRSQPISRSLTHGQ
jgi:hypothetical protein